MGGKGDGQGEGWAGRGDGRQIFNHLVIARSFLLITKNVNNNKLHGSAFYFVESYNLWHF